MERTPHHRDERVVIRRIVVGPYENNVFVVACARTGDAVIIDAADEPERIIAAAQGVRPRAILTTHGHQDHVQAVEDVAGHYAIPFRLHPADQQIAARTTTAPLADGDEITVGDLVIETLHTPGHTPGSVCFSLSGHLFSGDTLFPGGPGATRFPYSDFDEIIESITTKLFVLPPDTVVYPGHGLDTTIGTEQPHLQEWIERRW